MPGLYPEAQPLEDEEEEGGIILMDETRELPHVPRHEDLHVVVSLFEWLVAYFAPPYLNYDLLPANTNA